MRQKINNKTINVDSIKASKPKREKLFHISKRMAPSGKYLALLRGISIIVSLIFCALLFNIFAPGQFFNFFVYCFDASTSSINKLFRTLEEFAILFGIAIALLPAFKMKFWNLGAEGQVLIGGLCAGIVSRFVGPYLPGFLTIALMIVAAAAGGALWAFIPAIFKAIFNTNETLFTLMLNYLAMGIIASLSNLWDPSHGQFAGLTYGMFATPSNFNFLPHLITLIVVILMATGVFVYISFTKHGYELRVVGESVNTAKYIGIDVKKTIVRTLIISGALAGLVGWLIVAGQTHSISAATVDGRGFTGVMITWLGHFDVFEAALMAFLVAFISRGSAQAATKGHINNAYSTISVALFFFVILAFEFFSHYEIHFNRKNPLISRVFCRKQAKEEK